MSWQASVIGDGDQVWPPVDAFVPGPHCGSALAHGCCGDGTSFWRPLTAPPSLANSRGVLTTAACCGAASGTLMISIRHFEGSSPVGVLVLLASQPASSASGRTDAVPDT